MTGFRTTGTKKYKLLKKIEKELYKLARMGISVRNINKIPSLGAIKGKEWFFKMKTKHLTGLLGELTEFRLMNEQMLNRRKTQKNAG